MWIISCCYPSGVRRDLEAHSIRAEAENNAMRLRRFLGERFLIEVCFEVQEDAAN
jgi:hypothetical protein